MIARQSSIVVANSVLGALQGFLGLFIIVRYMGSEVLGERAYALALVSLVGIVARLGLPVTHVRRLAQKEQVAESNGAYLMVKGALTAIFMLVTLGAAFLWFGVLHKTTTDTTPAALWIAYWIVVVQSLRDVPVNSFQGLRMVVEREAVLFSNTFITILLTVLVGVAYADSHGRWSPFPWLGQQVSALLGVHGPLSGQTALAWLMLAFFLGEVGAFCLATFLFVKRKIPISRPPPGLARLYLLWTVPLMFLTVGEVMTKWLSQVMLGFWWDATELGQFAAASKLSEIFLLLGSSLAIVLLPAISALHARRDEPGAHRLVRDAERWMSLMLWPAVIVVALAAQPLIHVMLSDGVARAAPVLVVLAFQTLLASLVIPVQILAIGSGRPAFAARIVLITVVADAFMNLVLVPKSVGGIPAFGLGALGAAIAALGSTALALALYAPPSSTWRGHNVLRRPLMVHAFSAGVTYAAFRLWPTPLPQHFWSLAVYGLGVVAVYGLQLVLWRELVREDWHALRRLYSPQTAKTP